MIHCIEDCEINTTTIFSRSSNIAKILTAFYLFSIGYAIFTERHFFADGAHYFLQILEKKYFIKEHIFPRHHADYITQFIPVILIKIFNVKNLNLLSYAFGLGLYFPQLISLLLCYLIARKNNLYFMLFPIIALFGISLNVSFQIIHEGLIISYLLWPILFYLVLKNEFNWFDTIILLSLGFIFMRSFESASILGSLLLILLTTLMSERWHKTSVKTKIAWFLLLAMLWISIIIAIYFIIFPFSPENKADFLSSFPLILKHWPALLSTSYILVISLCIFIPKFTKSLLYKYVVLSLGIFTVFVSLIPVLVPDLTIPHLHHSAARLFMVYMLPFLSVIAFLVLKGIVVIPEIAWKKIVVLVAFLVIGQTTWQILATSQWDGFRHIFKEELTRHNGVVLFEDTILKKDKIGNQLVRPMIWGWTTPILSILWAKNQDVNTIIMNPSSALGQWQPFDPLVANDLPKIEEFGFSFEKYKNCLSKSYKFQG